MRIAVVSRDYMADDFLNHLTKIISVAESHSCEAIMFSLFSIHRTTHLIDLSCFMKKTIHVKRLILETGDLYRETDLRTELWCKELEFPLLFKRQFAYSTDSRHSKERLIQPLPMRILNGCCLLICGEANILKLNRKTRAIDDPFNISNALEHLGTKVVLSPWHTRTFRYELDIKRKELSRGRTVVSTWNQDSSSRRNSKVPWSAFQNGKKCTERIQEIPKPVSTRPDIRMGILNTP